MPWEIRKNGEKYCVYKKDETEPLHCYDNKKEAEDYLAALYANAGGKNITLIESIIEEVGKPTAISIKAAYPWEQCIRDQTERYGSEEIAKKVCGMIKAKYGGSPIDLPDDEELAKFLRMVERELGIKPQKEAWITVDQMRNICPTCADRMISKRLTKINMAYLDEIFGNKAGNIENLARHLANKYGGDPGFWSKCDQSEELADYDEDTRAAICARAHFIVTGKWPSQSAFIPPKHKENKSLEFGKPLQIMEFKSDGDDWEVSGYVSVFNNIDLSDDIVLPGAFQKSLNSRRKVRFLLNHDPKSVLGVPKELKEDNKGLFGRFKISKTRLGEETHQLLKDGAIDSFSFGYIAQEENYKDDGVRELKSIDLYEASLVAMPMNPDAIVTGFKEDISFIGRAKYIGDEMQKLLNDLSGLANDHPLSASKQQEIMELLEWYSGMDAVRSNLQSLLTAHPISLVEIHKIHSKIAELRKKYG